jgi:hypothetical protein
MIDLVHIQTQGKLLLLLRTDLVAAGSNDEMNNSFVIDHIEK